MVESVIPYILEKLENTKLETDPFKHLVIKDFIPEDYGRKFSLNQILTILAYRFRFSSTAK